MTSASRSGSPPGAVALVRRAVPEDVPALTRLIRALARSEGKRELDGIHEDRVMDWLFGPDPVIRGLLATRNEVPTGYLAWYPAFSLFKGAKVLLVENIYVDPAARGFGVGRALLAAAAREALRHGCTRLELHVRADNPQTLAFYARLGFTDPSEQVRRLDDEALCALAGY